MKKDYLFQIFQKDVAFLADLKEGDIIEFEMPSFCSGEYIATIHKDEIGLYIDRKENQYEGCRDYYKKEQ